MKLQEKIKAIELRREGKSYNEILQEVHVSRSTLSLWLRDVKLSPGQRKRLHTDLRYRGAIRGAKKNKQKRIKRTKRIISEAKREISSLIGSPLFIAGLV